MKNEDLLSVYEGAFEAWKAQLALGRIKALRFPRKEWPDLMQELAILILEFDYDPEHSSGAQEKTALFAAINRHLLYLMRRRCHDRQAYERYLRSLGIHEDGSYSGQEQCFEIDIPLMMDVQQAVEGLSAFDQRVATGLADGLNRAEIARQIDCDWKTVDKALGRIRMHCEELGINTEGLR